MAFRRIPKPFSKARGFSILSALSTVTLTSVLLGIFLVLAVIIFFAVQVPSPDQLSSRHQAQATKIYDRDSELLYDIFRDENRTPVKLGEIPDVMKQATISIEDKDFYKHQGFSLTGLARAVVYHGDRGGGSTLTQQLVKNTLLSSEYSLVRKLKEFILAIQVERVYSKDQILEMYLNEVPYGGTAYGIEAASNLYFGKSAKDLDLAEASLLAGLPQQPSVYSPYGTHPERSKDRQTEVLRRMVADSYITQEASEQALKTQLVYRTAQNEIGFKAPHFVLYVKQKLIEQFGDRMVEQGGLRVTTTLDYKLQEKVQDIVKEEVQKIEKQNATNGAAVVINPKTGEILSMVGSKDYFDQNYDGNVNVALSLRQPGSATKPITYAKGLQKGYTATAVFMDVRTDFPGGIGQPTYRPGNYDGQFRGPIQMRYALGNSLNIPAVKMLALVGIKDVMDLAYKMGVTSWEPTKENIDQVGLSLVLGGREVRLIDLTSSYGVFANKGEKNDPTAILKVTDSKGKVLYEHKQTPGQKVVEEEIAFIISDILSDNGARTAAFGANSILNISGQTVAVKTGTTDSKRDNWAIGYTPSYVVGVWVGNNDNTPMSPTIASGVTGASPIWNRVMRTVLAGSANEPFQKPDGVIYMEVDGLMGGTSKDGSPTRREYFVKGTAPNVVSAAYQHRKVCRNNPHRLAHDDQDGEGRDIIMLQESDPTGADFWQRGIEAWVLTASEPRFAGTSVGCDGVPGFSAGSGAISIVNIANGANVPRVFDVLASVNSANGIKKVTWTVDGSVRTSQMTEPFAYRVQFPEGDRGSHSITATLEDNNGGIFSTSIGVTVAL